VVPVLYIRYTVYVLCGAGIWPALLDKIDTEDQGTELVLKSTLTYFCWKLKAGFLSKCENEFVSSNLKCLQNLSFVDQKVWNLFLKGIMGRECLVSGWRDNAKVRGNPVAWQEANNGWLMQGYTVN
jgi:hypothetical protein